MLGHGEIALGLFALRHRLAPVDLGPYRKSGKHDGNARKPGDPEPLPPALRPLRPLEHLVGAKPDQRRHHLGKGDFLAVGGDVGGKHLDRIGGDRAIRSDREAHRQREGFGLRIPRLSFGDDRDHRAIGMARLEEPHLLVDVPALGRGRRAQHDQRRGGIECCDGLFGQAMPGGELVAVAEDWPQALGDRPRTGLAPDQLLVDGEALEPPVQPLRPLGVGVAVGQERPVFEHRRLSHGPGAPSPRAVRRTTRGSSSTLPSRNLSVRFARMSRPAASAWPASLARPWRLKASASLA